MKISATIDKIANLGKPAAIKEHGISAAEAGTTWNLLTSRYDIIESIMILINYVKDKDLHKQLQNLLKKNNRQANQLEKVMAEHAVAMPPSPPSEIKITENKSMSITDRYIFKRIFYSIQWFLPALLVPFQQSTSPTLRELFKNSLLEELETYETLQDFGLSKEWIEKEFDYKGAKSERQAQLTIMEAAQLWGRLAGRYDTIEFTRYMADLANGPDLRSAITIGVNMLKKHALELEKMAQDYAVPLPAKPPEAEVSTNPIDAIPDRYIFRNIIKGVQSWLPVMMIAFENCTTPAIRKRFKNMLTEEINVYDNFFAYGQLKGWVLELPSLRD
ncbi:MAG: DUF3231 family protein [Dehalobacterium sp.]